MTKIQLESYLSNLNLDYYTEDELQEIYDSVKSTVIKIEEKIGREGVEMIKNWLKEFNCKLSFNERAELVKNTEVFINKEKN